MSSKHIKSPKNTTAQDRELKPLVGSADKPVPRIRRIPTRSTAHTGTTDANINQLLRQASIANTNKVDAKPDKPSDDISKAGETSDANNRQLPGQASIANVSAKPDDNIVKVGILEESDPRFGPLYSVDQPSIQAIKDRAWNHVITKPTERNLNAAQVTEIYMRAIGRVEQEAKEMYAGNVSLLGPNFRWMMIKDGCFFLQLALLILGCSQQLGYPPNDPIFGTKHNKKDLKKWIQAMFYAGNQIPLVILGVLMRQDFFQGIIAKRNWDTLPLGLRSKVLYDVLVLPALAKDKGRISLRQRIISSMGIGGNANNDQQEQPCDILHCLHNLVIGPGGHASSASNHPIDIEAADEDVDIGIDDDDDGGERTPGGDVMRLLLNAIGVSRDIEHNRRRILFPSATELKQAGIHIARLGSGGARGICFKSYYFRAYLYLPVFSVDDTTETMLRNLKTYEECHEQSGRVIEGEVSSYVRLMSDIIQTKKDAKLVEKRGVVSGNPNDVEKLPGLLRRLSNEDVRLTHEFGVLRRQIGDYSSPWIHYKGLLNIVAFLTLLQTLFALLAYFKPPAD